MCVCVCVSVCVCVCVCVSVCVSGCWCRSAVFSRGWHVVTGHCSLLNQHGAVRCMVQRCMCVSVCAVCAERRKMERKWKTERNYVVGLVLDNHHFGCQKCPFSVSTKL